MRIIKNGLPSWQSNLIIINTNKFIHTKMVTHWLRDPANNNS